MQVLARERRWLFSLLGVVSIAASVALVASVSVNISLLVKARQWMHEAGLAHGYVNFSAWWGYLPGLFGWLAALVAIGGLLASHQSWDRASKSGLFFVGFLTLTLYLVAIIYPLHPQLSPLSPRGWLRISLSVLWCLTLIIAAGRIADRIPALMRSSLRTSRTATRLVSWGTHAFLYMCFLYMFSLLRFMNIGAHDPYPTFVSVTMDGLSVLLVNIASIAALLGQLAEGVVFAMIGLLLLWPPAAKHQGASEFPRIRQ